MARPVRVAQVEAAQAVGAGGHEEPAAEERQALGGSLAVGTAEIPRPVGVADVQHAQPALPGCEVGAATRQGHFEDPAGCRDHGPFAW